MQDLVLVSGGVRSGKTAYAESLLRHRHQESWFYWATGRALDSEMESRIAAHKKCRPPGVVTIEEGFRDLLASGRLAEEGDLREKPLLIDSLGFCVLELLEEEIEPWIDRFSAVLSGRRAMTVIVTDEVGLGGVAGSALGRRFADRIGLWNQRLSREAAQVWAVMMGCPLRLR
ncbi:MAG: bifunctional adenosylcobinamide kinase/adenosylcobinamide-phosphate guanylyltransferase [Nitrospirae bacterium]|nr:bifunctional adenosylcobinamide kinase/adenosylcobinamide-phosphate guanylyltransferase [Nitrospirota bacterium]